MVYDEIEYAISEEIRPQTLYVLLSRGITADESVWYLDGGGQLSHSSGVAHEYEQVIVATTDTHLIESGVQEIPATIVNKFLKLRKLVHKAHVKFLPDGTVDIRLEEEIHKEFVTHSIATRMRALGFKENCCAEYIEIDGTFQLKLDFWCYFYPVNPNNFLAPTWQSAFAWFRKFYGYNSYIVEAKKDTYRFHIEKFDEKNYISDKYDSYEEAQEKCLDKLCEIVEKHKENENKSN
jgi:hypothetical protein